MNGQAAREPAVEAAGLSYTFAGRARASLVDVSFRLEPGTFAVVAGRTGSGKSTLLRSLAGLIPHQASGVMSGRVLLCGHDTREQSSAELARVVGLVLQSPDDQLCTTTVEAELAFGLENLNVPTDEIGARIDDACRRYGLAGYRHVSVTKLSGGLKQRLVLAAVTAMRPSVLICDEPLSQLDSAAAQEFLDELARLKAEGLTIVVAEHRLDEILPHADRLLVLNEGKLTGDAPLAARSLAVTVLKQAGLRPPEVWDLEDALEACSAPTVGRGPTSALLPQAGDSVPGLLPPGEGGRRPDEGRVADRSPLAELADVSFRYPRAACEVWSNVSLQIKGAERIALVGPNGSGKSTLLGLLAGALEPSRGRLAWHGERRPHAALVPQQVDLTLFSRSVAEELAYGPRQMRLGDDEIAKRVSRAAELFQLESLVGEPPQALSQGERVRVALAAAYTLRPALLLLDEPTTGQDAPTVEALMTTLGRHVGEPHGPGALLFSTHDLRIAVRHADRVLVAADGRIAADLAPDELLDDGALLARVAPHLPPVWEFRRGRGLRALDFAGLRAELLASRSRS